MKNSIQKLSSTLIAAFVFSASFINAQMPAGYFGETQEHICNSSNQVSNYTVVDFAAINGDLAARSIITKINYTGTYQPVENFHSGLFYNGSKWAVYNENGVTDSIALGIGFNILAPAAHGSSFQHTSTAGNTTGNVTMIDAASTNNNPNALVFITHNWGQSLGVYNNHATGVFYSNAEGKWGIYNEDMTTFPIGAIYNIFVPDSGNPNAFVHTVTGSGSAGSVINSPLLNGNPQAKVFITRNFSPGGSQGSIYNTSPVCVFYFPGSGGHWFIYNNNDADFDSSTAYNVLVAEPMSSGLNDAHALDAQMELFPNPSSSEVSITYQLKEAKNISLKLYNMQGQVINTLFEGNQPPGNYRFTENVNCLNNGVYYLVLDTGGQISRKPLMVVK